MPITKVPRAYDHNFSNNHFYFANDRFAYYTINHDHGHEQIPISFIIHIDQPVQNLLYH